MLGKARVVRNRKRIDMVLITKILCILSNLNPCDNEEGRGHEFKQLTQ